MANGQVVFTTFHQSFSYEDFVEGLRAEPAEGQLQFRVVDGIFKRVCKSRPAAQSFAVGEVISSYVVRRASDEVVELEKKNSRHLPVPMSLLEQLAHLVEAGRISVDDIRNKQVFEKVPGTTLEPYLVNGYANVLAPCVERLLSKSDEDDRQPPPRVLIIDEINRGNVSRIFGELITLIEPSKRLGMAEEIRVTLPYSKESFGVPANVHVIATMNTADRSLVGMDIALRRRFEFKELTPKPELLDDIFIESLPMGALLRAMNDRIEVLLDRDHRIGHAYFLPLQTEPSVDQLSFVFKAKIMPLLQEYFFDDWERIRWVLNDHQKPAEQQFIRAAAAQAEALFGAGVQVSAPGTRWQVNDGAFLQLAAYQAILPTSN